MKKVWIILLGVVGVIGIAAAVGYFFFWEDLRLLFGGAPAKTEAGADRGGVNLMEEFSEAESPAQSAGGVSGDAPQDAPEQATEGADDASEGGADGAVDLADEPEGSTPAEGGAEGEAEIEEEPEAADDQGEEKKPLTPAPKKAEPVPTLSRKGEPAPAPAAAKPPPKPKPEPAPRPKPQTKPAPAAVERPAERRATVAEPRAEPAAPSGSAQIQKQAQILIQKRKYTEAENLLRQFLSTQPADGDIHFMMGFLYVQQNRKDQAVPHFIRAMQLAKDPTIRKMAEQYVQKLR